MKKRLFSLVLAAVMVLSLVACGKKAEDKPVVNTQDTTKPAESTDNSSNDTTTPADTSAEAADVTYVRGDDEEIYEGALGSYGALNAAGNAALDPDERFVLFAQAEANLLGSFVMIPTTTQGGAYSISRVAPRTVPYVQWGNDDDRVKGLVISDEFITPAEREELLAQWAAAVKGEGTYDPAGYLTSKGHSINRNYTLTFATAPVTLDWLNTSSQADTEITVNTVEGLVEYNNLGQMQPALAESWDVSDDGTVYTFHIRKGVNWYTSEGAEYAPVTAHDFEAGFHHMLDTKAGLEWLIDGVVVGGTDYYANGGSWDAVGYKALDDYTLEVTLERPISYFMTMLTYSCFLPICESFYQAHGGVFGVDEYAAASADTNTYTFGSAADVSSQVYCGPFLIQKLQKESEIYLVANKNYYNKDAVNLDSIKWVYDNGENPDALYNDTVKGTYVGISLGLPALLEKAKADGNFDKYSFVTDTTSTSYFGGLNLNRGTFALESGACATSKDEKAKVDTSVALSNLNFRKAMLYGFDKSTWNAVTRGEDLKNANLRNMYTSPNFVQLSADTTDSAGHTFPAGTFYGDMVQYYCDQLGLNINVADGVNGWYNVDLARQSLEAAKAELGDSVNWPIQIDVVYYSGSDSSTSQGNAYKKVMEDALGAENVVINLVEATTSEDFYACGYRAANGEAGNFDMFYGSGWGPDYGDPSTYLNTFLGEGAGYMTKVIGLF